MDDPHFGYKLKKSQKEHKGESKNLANDKFNLANQQIAK
jgi:hypothetical protein